MLGYLRFWRIPCQLTRLDFGDAAFVGNGPDGDTSVAIEIKEVHDALSCIGDGRFAGHQLPGLLSVYDRVWLVVEGRFYPEFSTGLLRAETGNRGRSKELFLGSRRTMYRDLDHWLTSMEVRAGLRLRRTRDRRETARVIADLWGWFQKDWSEHKSHLALHEETPDRAIFVRPSLLRKVAAQLEGVGWQKSQMVAQKFKTVENMMNASVEQWKEIPGIGKVLAERCYASLRGK